MANTWRWTSDNAAKRREQHIEDEAKRAVAAGEVPKELFGTMPVAGFRNQGQGQNQVPYRDAEGNAQTGYMKDGLTYSDAAMTQRVPVGSTVRTEGGEYKMTSNGGVPTYATARNNYANAGNAAIAAYEAASKAQEDRVNSATNAALAELNRQKGVVEQNRVDADKAARDAYERAANPFGAMEEQRVRLGLDNSGYAESSKLRLASDYAGQLTANIRSMNEQLGMLDVQIAEARASGKYELASILEARAQNVMSQKMALAGNLLSTDTSAIAQAESARQYDESMAENIRQYDTNLALQREQLDRQEAQTKEQNKYKLALTFLENGIDASFIVDELGIPKEDVARLADTVNTQIYSKLAASKKSSGGLTASQLAKIEEKNANTQYLTDAVADWRKTGLDIDTFLKDYGKVYGITSPADIKEFRTLARGGGGAPTPAPAGNGMSYSEVISKLNELKKDKNKYRDPNQAVENAIDIVDGAGLTPEQIAAIKVNYADFFGI